MNREPEGRLLTFADAAELLGVSLARLHRLARQPGFPPVVLLSDRRPRLWRHELLDFVGSTDLAPTRAEGGSEPDPSSVPLLLLGAARKKNR